MKSIGYGAYGDTQVVPFTGAPPIRLVRAQAKVTSEGEVNQQKTYSFEAGATPLMMFFAICGGAGLVYGVYKLFFKSE